MRRTERALRALVVLVACAGFYGVERLSAQDRDDQVAPEDAVAVKAAKPLAEEAPGLAPEPANVPVVREIYQLAPSEERMLRAVLDDFQMADVRSIGVVLAHAASIEAVQPRWEELVRETRPHSTNLPLLVRAVARETYHEANKAVHVHADKVRFYNEMKESLRREMERIEAERSLSPEGEGEWDAYHETLSEWLATIQEDAERANLDLQNALRKREQTLQSLSRLAAALHDTGMAIIRKMGG